MGKSTISMAIEPTSHVCRIQHGRRTSPEAAPLVARGNPDDTTVIVALVVEALERRGTRWEIRNESLSHGEIIR